jgi:hypothetical protein
MRPLIGLVLPLALMVGCTSPPTRYAWGHYEESIYTAYAKPGKEPPEKQIEILEADYQRARSHQKPVPPGWHAHLGYLYYQAGKADQAKQEFQTEKAEYPESTVFMDRLLARFKKS